MRVQAAELVVRVHERIAYSKLPEKEDTFRFRWDDGRIRLACDVSNWLRPDAEAVRMVETAKRHGLGLMIGAMVETRKVWC